MINKYRKINRTEKDMANNEVEEMDEENNEEEAQTLGGSGSNAGTGQGMQLSSPMVKIRPNNKVTITYTQRHVYNFRNGEGGKWQQRTETLRTGTNKGGFVNTHAIWTDYLCIPSHVLGFYLSPFELSDLVNPRYRTWTIHNADFEIKAVLVKPNTQIGGSDLKWQNINSPTPLMMVPKMGGVRYPYWAMGSQPNFGPGAGDTDPDIIGRGFDFAHLDALPAYRMGFGYEAWDPYIAPDPPTSTANQLFPSQTRQAFALRDLDIRPASEWTGYKHHNQVWPGSNQMLTDCELIFNTEDPSGNTSFSLIYPPTHQVGLGLMRATDRRTTCKADIRQKYFGAPVQHFHAGTSTTALSRRVTLQNFPVGGLWNGQYHQNFGPNNTMDGRDQHNMPFCIRTEDIVNPDGVVADYTVQMYIDSHCTITYDMEVAGGYQIYTPSLAEARHGHHMYGKSGWSMDPYGSNYFLGTDYYGFRTATNWVNTFDENDTDVTTWHGRQLHQCEAILNTELYTPPKSDLFTSRVQTRSMAKKNKENN